MNNVEDFNFKANLFFGKNWKFIFFGLIMLCLVGLIQLNGIGNRMSKLETTIAENNAKVVLTTVDGRAIKVTKTPLKAEYLKQYASSVFVNNFIVNRVTLTDNFRNNQFNKYSDILESSQSLALIWTDFIDQNDPKAKGFFISYLQWILNAIGTDKLPEYIAVKDYTLTQYNFNGDKYNLVLDIKVIAQSYALAHDKYVTQQGNIKISASGTFDLEKSTDGNPYGMRIDAFTIDMIKKGDR